MRVLLNFQYDNAPVSGNLVKITEIGGNTPLRYRVLGTEQIMHLETIRLPETGLLTLEVFDTEGYQLTVYDKDDVTPIYRKVYRPGENIDPEDFDDNWYIQDSSESTETVVVGVVVEDWVVNVNEDNTEEGVSIPISFIRSDGSVGNNANGLSSGGDGPYLANFSLDTDNGILTVTPREGEPGEFVGQTFFTMSGDFMAEVRITVNVLAV